MKLSVYFWFLVYLEVATGAAALYAHAHHKPVGFWAFFIAMICWAFMALREWKRASQ